MTDEELKKWLSADRDTIAGDGFSRRVLSALPPRPTPFPWKRPAILSVMAATGCWLGLFVFSGEESLQQALSLAQFQWLASQPVRWFVLVYVVSAVLVNGLVSESETAR